MDQVRSISKHPYRLFGTFRLTLAVMVLLSHASGFLPTFVRNLSLGNIGVFCFFILSGFVISEALDVFYRDNLKRFLLNRFLKIYPTYWIATIIGYFVLLYLGRTEFPPDPLLIAVNVTILLAHLPFGDSLLLITFAWAVLVELIFYLIIAGLFFIGVRLGKLTIILGGAGVLALALYMYVDITASFTRSFGVFRFAPFFVFGVAYYFLLVTRSKSAAVVALIGLAASMHSYLIYHESIPIEFRYAGLALFVFMIVVFALLPFVEVSETLEKIDKRFGDLTYGIYILHMPVTWLVFSYSLPPALLSGIAVVVSFALAWTVFVTVERPVMKLRDLVRGLRLYT